MILFLLLLVLVGGLVYYWQKKPIIVENFKDSDDSDFLKLVPSFDLRGQSMSGTVYMYYALTTFHLPGVTLGSDGIPAGGGDPRFNYLTNTQLRLATDAERAYFLRSGGVNRENTFFALAETFLRHAGVTGVARLVVSTKQPDVRWDMTGSRDVSFMIGNTVAYTGVPSSLVAIESVIQSNWIRGIMRYPFDNTGAFTVFKIVPEVYNEAIGNCIKVGKEVIKELKIKGISKIELDPGAPSIGAIATNQYITFHDTNLRSVGSSSSSANSTNNTSTIDIYTGEIIANKTSTNIKDKLIDLSNNIFTRPSTFKSFTGQDVNLLGSLQQRCGVTIFNKLTFEGTIDAPACASAINLLEKYNIAFSNYTNLIECSFCGDTVVGCKPNDPLPDIQSVEKLTSPLQPPRSGFNPGTRDASGVLLRINSIKLGNEFTYELQLNDVSDTADNSSKYVFNPFRFIAGKRNNEADDIIKLEIVINEYINVIQVFNVNTNGIRKNLIGEIQTPVNFKLYSSIKLQGIIRTFANKSTIPGTEKYSVLAIEQDITDSGRYDLYETEIYDHTQTRNTINFIYSDANTIQITFTVGTRSRTIPGGNYTLLFNNTELGTFIDNNNITVDQFNRILLNVLSGKLTFMNNSSEVYSIDSKCKEQANSLNFTFTLNDPTNTKTYYTGEYSVLGNRYTSQENSPSSDNSITDDNEVVFIEVPMKDGINSENAIKLASSLGEPIATIEQVVKAMQGGANWCSPGWCIFIDKYGQQVLRAAYPVTSQLTDPKCIKQDDLTESFTNGIVVVSTPTNLKANLMLFKKKENNPVNITQNNQIFKQAYFNAMTGKWKSKSTIEIEKNEIFAVTKNSGGLANTEIPDLISYLGCTIVTEEQIERQLEYIKGLNIPLPNITVAGWALNSSNMYIKIQLDGKFTKLPANTQFINSVYCYGNKSFANAKLKDENYTMQAYNAQLNIANQNDTNINYKPLTFKTQPLINKASQYNVKGALILKEIQETPQGIVKEGFTSSSYKNMYAGCDKNAYGCIALSGSGEKPSVPLVSKNGKFQIIDMSGTAFNKPISINQGIQNARDCQTQGGDIAITDETYPGCPAGQCCEPAEPVDNTILDTSMFADTCDDSNTASAIEQCDETEEVLSSNQQSFEPYKLTRIQRTKTPTTAKCSKPKLSKSLKEAFKNTPEYIRDVYQITKNEHMFSLRMM
jgi:hypothetical protein